VIAVRAVTKRYGGITAVDDVTFDVRPGVVTGLLGPNGSGKSTTMRIVLGLDHPTAGEATIDGRRYADLPSPARAVGALLDAGAAEYGRRARDHLRWMARAARLPRGRVDEVSPWSAWPAGRRRGSARCRWGCGSGSGSPPRCSATRAR
jgi:ABC-2 type transport system ATP-binding protein